MRREEKAIREHYQRMGIDAKVDMTRASGLVQKPYKGSGETYGIDYHSEQGSYR